MCLTMPPEEVNSIARFKALQRNRKRCCCQPANCRGVTRKGGTGEEGGGTVPRGAPEYLFALGMTEKEEKAERRVLMKAISAANWKPHFMWPGSWTGCVAD